MLTKSNISPISLFYPPSIALFSLLLFGVIYFLPFSESLFANENHEESFKELLLDEPSSFVNHSVNVITGNYHESEIDLEVAGPHPLFFRRSYVSSPSKGNLCYQWNTNHHASAYTSGPKTEYKYAPNPDYENFDPENSNTEDYPEPYTKVSQNRYSYTHVVGDYGAISSYEGNYPKGRCHAVPHFIHEQIFQKHITNSPEFSLAPGNHLRNNVLLFENGDKNLTLVTGDGYKRYFCKNKKNRNYELHYEGQPYGCIISYDPPYRKKKSHAFRKICLKNKGRAELSHFHIDTSSDTTHHVLGSDEKWIKYHYGSLKGSNESYLKSVEGSEIPTQTYKYQNEKIKKHPKIIQKNYPDGRFLKTSYYEKHHRKDFLEKVSTDNHPDINGKVMLQKAPVGTDSTPIVTHRYFYHLKNNWINEKRAIADRYTSVYNAHRCKTDYHFNEDFRITDIHKWTEDNASIHSIERSFWGANDTSDSTNLISRTLADGNNEIELCRSYVYDLYGNATHKCLWGNLTGKHTGQMILDVSGIPFPWTSECFVKSYQFANGQPSLLLSESDGKKTIEYTYQAGTNLNTARFVKVGDKIHKREFISFDDNGCPYSIVTDDGTGREVNDLTDVSERRLTLMFNRSTAPIGLPQIIEQYYVDLATNQNVLLGRVVNTHSKKGKILSQEHYDSDGLLRFTLHWEYDSKGNLTKETDALGRIINRQYDANKNLIFEEGPHPGVYKEFKYDFVNRLIGIKEGHPDGINLTTSFRYDFLGNKIAETDPYGQEIRYVYDSQNRKIQTIYPVVLDENMVPVQPKKHIGYDLLDNPCSLIDEAGGVTTILYTAHNKPYHKTYPDGTVEKFEYDLSGNLVMSIAQNGTKTLYTYDAFDRMITKEMYTADHEFIQKESNVYNTFHVVSKTDPDGMTTDYRYDKSGKLVEITKGEMRTGYEYDTLGRESKTLML